MKLKIEIEQTENGPVLKSWYDTVPDASYLPARNDDDLRSMVLQVLQEWMTANAGGETRRKPEGDA